ncbi:hypothetical protein [uncultured Phycicoccus sp.]|uniref:hypothetical protein n=1 Tax=uncultured Phycicoccus sp. TaxID=661422 RepID=UPI002623AE06|nr:hypothetical protein [uncultured Phycicoccus sp.]
MADEKPTVRSLDRRMGGVEQQLGEVADSLGRVQRSIHQLSEGTESQSERLWTALGSIGGLDDIGRGLADIAEVLAPMRQFAPPSTAVDLEDGVAEALGTIRASLGGDQRTLNFTSLETDWDGPVRFIGEAVPPMYRPHDAKDGPR